DHVAALRGEAAREADRAGGLRLVDGDGPAARGGARRLAVQPCRDLIGSERDAEEALGEGLEAFGLLGLGARARERRTAAIGLDAGNLVAERRRDHPDIGPERARPSQSCDVAAIALPDRDAPAHG